MVEDGPAVERSTAREQPGRKRRLRRHAREFPAALEAAQNDAKCGGEMEKRRERWKAVVEVKGGEATQRGSERHLRGRIDVRGCEEFPPSDRREQAKSL